MYFSNTACADYQPAQLNRAKLLGDCLIEFDEETCLGTDILIIKQNNGCVEVNGGSACSTHIKLNNLPKDENRIIIRQSNKGTNVAIGNSQAGSIIIE